MGEAEIYVTFGKADVKTDNCLRCRRIIKRDDELWNLSISGLRFFNFSSSSPGGLEEAS